MKRLGIIAALVLGGLVLGVMATSAQEAKERKQRPPGERGGPSIQQRVDMMSRELKLSDEQKTKVTALFEAEAKKRQELFNDQTTPREQRREKMQALMQEQNKKLKEILTTEQYEKWEKMRAGMRQRGPGGPGGPEEKKGEAKKEQKKKE